MPSSAPYTFHFRPLVILNKWPDETFTNWIIPPGRPNPSPLKYSWSIVSSWSVWLRPVAIFWMLICSLTCGKIVSYTHRAASSGERGRVFGVWRHTNFMAIKKGIFHFVTQGSLQSGHLPPILFPVNMWSRCATYRKNPQHVRKFIKKMEETNRVQDLGETPTIILSPSFTILYFFMVF